MGSFDNTLSHLCKNASTPKRSAFYLFRWFSKSKSEGVSSSRTDASSRPKRPMHTSESAAIVVAHSLRAHNVAIPCAPARSACLNSTCSGNAECHAVPQRRGGQPAWSERPQRENAFVHRLTPPTGEGRAVHLTRGAPSRWSARGLEKK